jgi:hypothetical protein
MAQTFEELPHIDENETMWVNKNKDFLRSRKEYYGGMLQQNEFKFIKISQVW